MNQWILIVFKLGSFKELATIVKKRATKCQNATSHSKESKQDISGAQYPVRAGEYHYKPQVTNTHLVTLRDCLCLQFHSPIHPEMTGQKLHNNSIRKTTEDCCIGRSPYDKHRRKQKANATHNKN